MFPSPINNISSLLGQRMMAQVNASMNQTMYRLSTGLSINRGADNPAGLMSSEALRSQLKAIEAASRNIQRADSVMNVADAGLGEIGNLLGDLDGLVVSAANSAGMSAAEREAMQVEVDSILNSIDRIARSTSFADRRLIDGSLEARLMNISSSVESIDVYATSLGAGQSMDLNINVTQAAETASLVLDFDGASLDMGGSGGAFEFVVQGIQGEVTFAFASGATMDDIAAAINAQSGSTGVSALASGTTVVLKSSGYGSDSFVSVEVLDDGGLIAGAGAGVYQTIAGSGGAIDAGSAVAFDENAGVVRAEGIDVAGTLNGVVASGHGTTLSVNTSSLSMSVELTSAAASTTGGMRAATVSGGASFQIGPQISSVFRVGLGLMDAGASRLGRFGMGGERFSLADLKSGGHLNLADGDITGAQRAVRGAIAQVSSERARLGGFQSGALRSQSAALSVALENKTAAQSIIRDTDFAFEAARFARDAILMNSSLLMFGFAASRPRSVLGLLG